MSFDYNELEHLLEKACAEVNRTFQKKFSSDMYISAGGAKLEAFINDLQEQLETTAVNFIVKHNLEKDAEAKKRVFSITKLYAKKCVENFSRV